MEENEIIEEIDGEDIIEETIEIPEIENPDEKEQEIIEIEAEGGM